MIATATEGGAALFPIFYYMKEAFLAQSPQLYKEQLMKEAKLETPKSIPNPKEINKLVIAKRHGAAVGKGYFLASTEKEYNEKRDRLIKEGIINGDSDLYIQEYTSGVLAYLPFYLCV